MGANGINPAIFHAISGRLGIGVVLCDPSDRIVWTCDWVEEKFPSAFPPGKSFSSQLGEIGVAATGSTPLVSLARSESLGEIYRASRKSCDVAYFRHVPLTRVGDAEAVSVHCLMDATREIELEDTFYDHLQQLTSMKEIIDTLYESVRTQEVLYLILVAVTSQMGFGFNRAFYLEASGKRLRGKIGIGPSNIEDAHRIWSRLAELNLPNLRAIYEDLTLSDEPPDPQTREIAARMDFPLRKTNVGLVGAIESRKPTLIDSSGPRTKVDDALFGLLGTDAVAVVPLYVRESLAGVIIADNFITKQPITEKALNVLKTFSGYAGVALERSQLYDELRESVAKLQSANERLKNNQQRLLQAEKLSAIGELAACVSHEIRNPMVAIGGLARTLLKDESLSSQSRETLEMIVSEVTRLEKFLRETLHFVRPQVVGARSVDLREEVERCISAFRPELTENSIELDVRLCAAPLRSLVDPDLLRRALSNLLKNAIEAVGPEGRIVVEARRGSFSAEIRIADSGPGIPEELKERIFELFFTTKSEGTGLGLAIASHGIRSLGGQISLQESREFKTIFSVTLPLEEVAPRASRGDKVEAKGR